MSSPVSPPPPAERPAVVIDTNVVFEWLVFRNPGCQALVSAIEAGSVRWVSTAEMRHELHHVLGRGVIAHYQPDLPAIEATWDRLGEMLPAPEPRLVPLLRCTDRDDQKFIDLALQSARWLVTRDRAVLKLAKRARALGVEFTTPERWTPAQ